MPIDLSTVETGIGYTPVFSWSVASLLPPGLAGAQGSDGSVFEITGTPNEVGIFPCRVLVSDQAQHLAEFHFIIEVLGTGFPDAGFLQNLPLAVQGEVYPTTHLDLAGGGDGVTFSPSSGALPPDLALSTDGTISGTCAETAAPGTHTFSVTVKDTLGEQEQLPLVINVEPFPVAKGGCMTAGGDFLLLASLASLGLRRGRRQ